MKDENKKDFIEYINSNKDNLDSILNFAFDVVPENLVTRSSYSLVYELFHFGLLDRERAVNILVDDFLKHEETFYDHDPLYIIMKLADNKSKRLEIGRRIFSSKNDYAIYSFFNNYFDKQSDLLCEPKHSKKDACISMDEAYKVYQSMNSLEEKLVVLSIISSKWEDLNSKAISELKKMYFDNTKNFDNRGIIIRALNYSEDGNKFLVRRFSETKDYLEKVQIAKSFRMGVKTLLDPDYNEFVYSFAVAKAIVENPKSTNFRIGGPDGKEIKVYPVKFVEPDCEEQESNNKDDTPPCPMLECMVSTNTKEEDKYINCTPKNMDSFSKSKGIILKTKRGDSEMRLFHR